MQTNNVSDRRYDFIGSWETAPLSYSELSESDIGRTVIYQDHGRAEAGTLSSWKHGIVFARYSKGGTAAGAEPDRLSFGIRALKIGSFVPPVPDELL
jgi:hypothetical protein